MELWRGLPLSLTYQLKEKASMIAECLENHFKPHDLYDENHKRRVKVRVQIMLEAVDDTLLEKV
jgi:hypothetical protein